MAAGSWCDARDRDKRKIVSGLSLFPGGSPQPAMRSIRDSCAGWTIVCRATPPGPEKRQRGLGTYAKQIYVSSCESDPAAVNLSFSTL